MAQEDAADIFMIFRIGGANLPGECTTELKTAASNEFLAGFQPGAMFEITKFDFGVGANQEVVDEFQQRNMQAALASLPPAQRPKPRRPKSIPGQSLDDTPVTIQPISFSRRMDIASQLLLHHTIKRTYFDRVALVKRKSAGGSAAGQAYLRMDFEGVILIEANWNNDDPVEESYSFHTRSITIRYKPQLPDGTLGVAKIGFWSMVPNAREASL